MRRLLSYSLISVLLISCSIIPCANTSDFQYCVQCKNENHATNWSLKLNEQVAQFDKHLLDNSIVPSVTRSDYISIFRDSLHFEINREKMIIKVDDSFISSPITFSNYIECAQNNKAVDWANFCSELKNLPGSEKESFNAADVLGALTDEQFENKNVKLFFQLLINNDVVALDKDQKN